MILTLLAIVASQSLMVALPAAGALSDASLLEVGSAEKTNAKIASRDEIKIVSYNMRWRGGNDLRRLIDLLKTDKEIGRAAIIGLQEVDRDKTRTNRVNTARLIADELGMHYAWAGPPLAKDKEGEEEETGVAILSLFPLTDASRIVLPHEGPGGRRRVALGATAHIGEKELRVYSVHAETRTTNEKRLAQFQAVIDDLAAHPGVTQSVILGDFNTITGKDVDATTRLFEAAGFSTPFSNKESTWKTFIIELKLDWVWLRKLKVKAFGIDKKIGLSDHWPLWAEVEIK